MGLSARILADDPDKSGIAEDLLFKTGILGRCGLCGETVVIKNDYKNMDKLASDINKAHPNTLKSYFHDDPVLMKDYICNEYADAAFQCEDCNEKFADSDDE